MINGIHEDIRRRIQAARTILVTTHIRPDGDAIGSLLGLGLALRQTGKSVQMVSTDGVPASYRHLPGTQDVLQRVKSPVDLTIVVDCSDLDRTGTGLDKAAVPDLNIDHHITNCHFARLNLVVTGAVATTEIIADSLPAWGLSITAEVAAALLTGLVTDTLGFRTSNMTPKALRLAADLMEAGADLPDLYMRALVQHSFEALRFWGAGLISIERDGAIVWTKLSMADRQAAHYPGRDDADLINVLSAVNDASISIIFVEQPNGNIKVSWRSQPGYDVSTIAVQFGGGGHPNAAGAEVKGNFEQVIPNVLSETRKVVQEEISA